MSDRRDAQVIPFTGPRLADDLPAVALHDVCVTRGGAALLNGLTLRIGLSGITAIVGPNGAGKSLLLHAIAGLIQPDHGTITRHRAIQGRIGLVFQRPVLLRRTVRGNLRHALALARVPRRERRARLQELLALANLTALAMRPARRLSGGEQQRLATIRALASTPILLMLDEPTAHLDPQATHAMEALITRIARQGTKVVIVTHDQGQVQRLADDVAFLHNGQCFEVTDAPSFLSHPKTDEARAYVQGRLLL
jgi:tungstate transport system ATP-binding protein